MTRTSSPILPLLHFAVIPVVVETMISTVTIDSKRIRWLSSIMMIHPVLSLA